jgi:hypothetical protein
MANEEFGIEVSGDCQGACTESCGLDCIPKLDLGIEIHEYRRNMERRYFDRRTCHSGETGFELLSL